MCSIWVCNCNVNSNVWNSKGTRIAKTFQQKKNNGGRMTSNSKSYLFKTTGIKTERHSHGDRSIKGTQLRTWKAWFMNEERQVKKRYLGNWLSTWEKIKQLTQEWTCMWCGKRDVVEVMETLHPPVPPPQCPWWEPASALGWAPYFRASWPLIWCLFTRPQ